MFIIGTGRSVACDAAQIAVERCLLRCRLRARSGHGDSENRIRAEPAFVRCAVDLDHLAVDCALLARVHALQSGTKFGRDVLGGLARALAEIPSFVAIAQLNGFVFARRCAGRDSGASHAAVSKEDIRLHSRVATRVEYLSTNYLYDFHWCCPLSGFVVKSQFRTR